jgi:uncharacterized LabA/DUF88 family protein
MPTKRFRTLSQEAAERMYQSNYQHIIISKGWENFPPLTEEEIDRVERGHRGELTEEEVDEEWVEVMHDEARSSAEAAYIKAIEDAAHPQAHRIAEAAAQYNEERIIKVGFDINEAQDVFQTTYKDIYLRTYEKLYKQIQNEDSKRLSEIYNQVFEEDLRKVGLDKHGNKLP